ncbi:hypothetical protein FRB95_005195 [Tulasnella sp. JGI-2019a]|nr:hypothetical protein FRB93_002371 [Tulasnella sp. JGI-2019a]KAG9029566.1 hypothetical protein FRB95_005195 [Tulasnella sp. JGI-2019a]
MNSALPYSQHLKLAMGSIHPPTSTPWYYSPAPSLLPGLPDKILALISPLIFYWVFSLFFHLLDVYSTRPPFSWMNIERYRIHDNEEMKAKNQVTPNQVFRAVVIQQILQTVLGYWWLEDDVPGSMDAPTPVEVHVDAMLRLAPAVVRVASILLGNVTAANLIRNYGNAILWTVYWYLIPMAQIFLAFFAMDTWQYFLHRLFHVNKFLYKHIHSVHHRLYVPYAYGALYNHPLEGFVFDSLGAVVSESFASLSVRQSALLFAFSSAKTVDDHCGFSLPWDPLQYFYRNNARFHDIHHQHYGLKYNFSQPFWIHWDVLLGTRWDKPAKPLAAEKAAFLAAAEERKKLADEFRREPSSDSELSSDSGIAMINKEE